MDVNQITDGMEMEHSDRLAANVRILEDLKAQFCLRTLFFDH